MSVEKLNSTELPTFSHILCMSHRCIIQILTAFAAHATKVPGLIFLSGQTPVGKDGKLVEGGIKEHTV